MPCTSSAKIEFFYFVIYSTYFGIAQSVRLRVSLSMRFTVTSYLLLRGRPEEGRSYIPDGTVCMENSLSSPLRFLSFLCSPSRMVRTRISDFFGGPSAL